MVYVSIRFECGSAIFKKLNIAKIQFLFQIWTTYRPLESSFRNEFENRFECESEIFEKVDSCEHVVFFSRSGRRIDRPKALFVRNSMVYVRIRFECESANDVKLGTVMSSLTPAKLQFCWWISTKPLSFTISSLTYQRIYA